MAADATLSLGYVARAHGLGGAVVVRLYNPRGDGLRPGTEVLCVPASGTPRDLEVAGVRPGPDASRQIVRFAGVDSREAADALRGCAVHVAVGALSPPGDDEFYYGEVVGWAVVDEGGVALGQVDHVFEGAGDILVVHGAAGEWMLPVVPEVVRRIDRPNRRFVVAVPDGLEAQPIEPR